MFVKSRSVIVATGIWSAETAEKLGVRPAARLCIRPTRGSHIVLPYEKFPIDHAVTMAAPRDGRAMFVIPWNRMTVLGTTDTDHDGDMQDVFASRWDVEYLLESARHNFPGFQGTPADVVGTWSGLRPLIASAGSESSVSREHSIVTDDRGIVTIAGGKLTTYRVMAAQALRAAAPFFNKPLRRSTAGTVPLACSAGLQKPGARASLAEEIINACGLDGAVADSLVTNYGNDAIEIGRIARTDASLAAPLVNGHPFIGAEIVYAARHEMAVTLEDALLRRTPAFFLSRDEDCATIRRAAAIMGAECGWDAARLEAEVAGLQARKQKHIDCVR